MRIFRHEIGTTVRWLKPRWVHECGGQQFRLLSAGSGKAEAQCVAILKVSCFPTASAIAIHPHSCSGVEWQSYHTDRGKTCLCVPSVCLRHHFSVELWEPPTPTFLRGRGIWWRSSSSSSIDVGETSTNACKVSTQLVWWRNTFGWIGRVWMLFGWRWVENTAMNIEFNASAHVLGYCLDGYPFVLCYHAQTILKFNAVVGRRLEI